MQILACTQISTLDSNLHIAKVYNTIPAKITHVFQIKGEKKKVFTDQDPADAYLRLPSIPPAGSASKTASTDQ